MTRLLEDIMREPEALLGSLRHTLGPGREALHSAARLLRDARTVVITGIGSSWHAGMAAQALALRAERPVLLLDTSELVHTAELPPDTTIVALSRSGMSIEIVQTVEKAQRAGARLIAVTNTPDSRLAHVAEVVLPLEAPFDHNVSVTMYTALALVAGLAVEVAFGTLDDALAADLEDALTAARAALPIWHERAEAADWLRSTSPTYFLARRGSLASCHEARLLWEEAAKAPASALTTGGFRHGPQEMLTPDTRVGIWLDGALMRDADMALVRDLRANGVQTMLVGQQVEENAADLVFNLPPISPAWQFLVDIIPAQFAAERLARARGVDCDNFRFCSYIVEDEGGL